MYLAEIMTDSLTNYLISSDPYSHRKCVAIKRINTKNTTHRDIYRRTENEIKIHKLLHHKYIVKFYVFYSIVINLTRKHLMIQRVLIL